MAQTIILRDVRLSYPELFTPREYQPGDGKPRYSATFLIEPGSENHKALMAGIQTEMKEAFGAKAKARYEAMKSDSKSFCYVSGDLKDDDNMADKMILSSHRQAQKGAPAVVDRDPKKALTAADGKPYAGCYVNAKVDIYVQSKGNVGVRCGLLGVQFSKDGEAFAGGPATADGFEDIADGSDSEDFVDGAPGTLGGGAKAVEDEFEDF